MDFFDLTGFEVRKSREFGSTLNESADPLVMKQSVRVSIHELKSANVDFRIIVFQFFNFC